MSPRKLITNVAFLAIAVASIHPSLPVLAQNAEAEKVINRFVAEQARKMRGSEYKDARIVITGDLFGEGKPDLAVQYTIEGMNRTNNYTQYLAVFKNVDDKYVYKAFCVVGGKNQRSVTLKSIEDRKIQVETLEYLPNDPSCCPSKKSRAFFGLENGKLHEVTNG